MAEPLNPITGGIAGVSLAAAHLAKQVEWGHITLAQGKAVVEQALSMLKDPDQRAAVETVYRSALPGLF